MAANRHTRSRHHGLPGGIHSTIWWNVLSGKALLYLVAVALIGVSIWVLPEG